MPTVSAKQHRAMQAAAAGNSTLGIPVDIGREMVKADMAHTKMKPYKKGYKKGMKKGYKKGMKKK